MTLPGVNLDEAEADPVRTSTVIYALIDPRTHAPRYVGKTSVGLNIRFTSHMRDSRPSWKVNWINSLRDDGLDPLMETLEDLGSDAKLEDWQEAERFWISYLRSLGASLTNLTDGGEGLHGLVFTPEHKMKIGAAHKGRKRSPETCARMAESRKNVSCEHLRRFAESQRGKPLSIEHRKKLSKVWLGRKHTPETKAKMSMAAIGRKKSAEARANMSIAQKHRSKEHQEKISASKRGRSVSEQARANMSAAQLGRKHSPETIMRMRDSAQKRRMMSQNAT